MNAQGSPLEKIPPHSQEAEMALLGAVFLDRIVLDKTAEKLTPDMFYNLSHQTIFRAMMELYEQNGIVDVVTMTNKLATMGQIEMIGGAVYLTDLVDAVSTTAHADNWIDLIFDKYTLRSLINTATQIVQNCYESGDTADMLLDKAEKQIFDIADKKVTESFTPIKGLLHDVVIRIEKLHEDKHFVSGIPSGFDDLDDLTSGFQDSDMIVLAARPSMGKTSLAMRIVEYLSIDKGLPVAVFSLEMSNEQLTQRMLCSRAKLNSQSVRKGIFPDSRWRDLTDAASDLSNAPIMLNDTPSINALQLRAIARRLKATHDIKMVFIDYLQLMQGTSKQYGSRQQEISEISRSMKALARELSVPVMVLSQLNREVENRPNKRPQLSDLRESGAIEQDADVVMLMVRQEVYDPDVNPGLTELIIAKQRNGPTGEVKLTFLSEFARFEPSTESVNIDSIEEVNF